MATTSLSCLFVAGCASIQPASQPLSLPVTDNADVLGVKPLTVGESFKLKSAVLGEERQINVFKPNIYGQKIEEPLPVLYMLDGGIDEDFLHIAGLVQILTCNGGIRPHLLVGIQNTRRRRDMTGPTTNPEDRKIAAVVGGSVAFRRFIREELKPAVRSRYHTTDATAIVGESLAGLFVVETLLREPDLFDTYIAIDPSLWWNNNALVAEAKGSDLAFVNEPIRKALYVSCSNETGMPELATKFSMSLQKRVSNPTVVQLQVFATESHATIYHPAALSSFRNALAPPAAARQSGN